MGLLLRSVPWVWLGDPSQPANENVTGNFSSLDDPSDLDSAIYSRTVRLFSNEWCLKVRSDQEDVKNDPSSDGVWVFFEFE